jgi:CheY-like chemotaxis protein
MAPPALAALADVELLVPFKRAALGAVLLGTAVAASPSADEQSAAARSPLRGSRVLLAEDDATSRYASARMLELLGCRLGLAADGTEALRAADAEPFDLILMDVQMPGLDGLQATRRIRDGSGPNRATPIIALTANAFAQDVQLCLAAGMTGHLAKPLRLQELRSALLRHLDGLARTPPRATPAMADGGLFDLNVIVALEEDLPREAVDRLIRLFADTQGPRIAGMAALVSAGQHAELVRAAHSLKGAARLFGALRLGELAEALERAAGAGEPPGESLLAQIAGLRTEFEAVSAALSGRLRTPTAA